jgi:signal transduction histidine kinase
MPDVPHHPPEVARDIESPQVNSNEKSTGDVVVMPVPGDPSRNKVLSWSKRLARRNDVSAERAEWSTANDGTPFPTPPEFARGIHWQLKAMLPLAFALFNGILLFLLATVGLTISQRNTVLALAAGGAVAICASLLIGLALVVGRPMLELQSTIARVRTGDLAARVSFANRKDEIGDLGRNFNAMVQELAESREEIQRLHRTQMSRAEHLATLGEMAAGLAHEIRNPLAGIAGVIEVMGRDLPKDSPAREVMTEVRGEVQQITRTVNDLLETARPKAPAIRPSNLNATVEHAVFFARQQVGEKKIGFEVLKAENLPTVEHDAGQLQQVLLNLMLNAIQAIENSGTVTVEVHRRDVYAAITVGDTGKGIPADHMPHIFRPFFTTKGDGTGLGLSLSRRIVEEHNGRIEVTSRAGIGSQFTVLIPFRQPA